MSTLRFLCRAALLAAALLSGPVAAAAPEFTAVPSERGLGPEDFPRVVPLAPGVYGYEDLRDGGFTTVSLFVVGEKGVLLADGQGNPAAMDRLLQAIRRVTPKPVRWYVVGSDHLDHTGGNSRLPRDVRYIVHPASRAQLAEDAAGRGPVPSPWPVVVPPSAMKTDRLALNIGGRVVEVLFLGRAHTGGDLMVHLPEEKILFMGETFFNHLFPGMRSAYPSEWLATVDRALAMDIRTYVPGHGFVESPARSRRALQSFRAALAAVIGEAKRLHALGLPAAEAAEAADWGPYGRWMLGDTGGPVAIRRVYDEQKGRLPAPVALKAP